MSSTQLLTLYGPVNRVHDSALDLVSRMADHHRDTGWMQLKPRVQHMCKQGLARQAVQDLGHRGFHASTLAGGKYDQANGHRFPQPFKRHIIP
jgi:hypothetical protein